MNETPMTFGSLFAGIGGFDLGLTRIGMSCKFQVEIDEYCRRVLTKHWPDVPKFGDIRECGAHNLPPVDLICGGFPCQPFSVAGKRKGAGDDRFLWPEMLRVIEEIRPTWVVGENVPGIIRMELDRVLSDLETIGYSTRTFVIPACAVGAPHRRERIWILANTRCTKQPGRDKKTDEQRYGNSTRRKPASHGSPARKANVTSNAESDLWRTPRDDRPAAPNGSGLLVANASIRRCGGQISGEVEFKGRAETVSGSETIPDSEVNDIGTGLCEKEPGGQRWGRSSDSDWWTVEPDVGRVAHGVPSRVDRLKSLGNAVVPQFVEFIGRSILEFERSTNA